MATSGAGTTVPDHGPSGGAGGGGTPRASLPKPKPLTERTLSRGESFSSLDSQSLQRVKNLMAAHYGTGGVNSPRGRGPSKETDDALSDVDEDELRAREAGALDLNSPHFKVDKYVAEKLKSTTFQQLLDRDEELVREIKTLDSDVQLLVYENYQKFIGATDTMRSMKDKLFQMEGEVSGLEARMEAVATATKRMNERSATRQQTVARLDRQAKLLTKLQDLYELPRSLQSCAVEDLDQVCHLIDFYSQASGFLAKQSAVSTFAEIASSSRTALAGLKARLVDRLDRVDPEIGNDVLDAVVDASMALGESKSAAARVFLGWHLGKLSKTAVMRDTDSIQDFVTVNIREQLLDTLAFAAKRCETFAGWRGDEAVQDLAVDFSKELMRSALSRLRGLFDNQPSHFRLSAVSSLQPATSTSSIGGGAAVVSTAGLASLTHGADGVGSGGTGGGGSHTDETDTERTARQTSGFLEGLSFAMREIQLLDKRLPPFLAQKLRLGDRAAEIGERAVRRQIAAAMSELRRRAEERLRSELPTDENRLESLRREIDEASSGLVADAKSARTHLDSMLRDGGGRDALAELATSLQDLFKFQLQEWVMWLADALRPAGAALPTYRVRVLAHALIARNVAAQIDSLRLADAKTAREALRASSDDAVRAFVVQVGVDAAKKTVCREALRATEAHARPSFVNPATITMLDEIGAASKVLRSAGVPPSRASGVGGGKTGLGIGGDVGLGSRLGAAAVVRHSSSSAASSGSALRVDIERLFTDKAVVFGRVELETDAVLVAALGVALKTWTETLRELVLSTSGLQQIQLDAQFVRHVAPHLASDIVSVSKLVAELVTAAKERCGAPQLLEGSVVDALCNVKRDAVNAKAWHPERTLGTTTPMGAATMGGHTTTTTTTTGTSGSSRLAPR